VIGSASSAGDLVTTFRIADPQGASVADKWTLVVLVRWDRVVR